VFLSDRDLSTGPPPVPGLGVIACHKVDALTAARVARALVTLLRFIGELDL
jgi:hypothetical protein